MEREVKNVGVTTHQSKEINRVPQMINAKLLFEELPTIDEMRIARNLKVHFGNVECRVEETSEETVWVFEFMDDLANNRLDVSGKNKVVLSVAKRERQELPSFLPELQKSWNWKIVEKEIENCGYEVGFSDMITGSLEKQERVAIFYKLLKSVIDTVGPKAIWMTASNRILPVDDFVKNGSRNDYQNIYGLLNVRVFQPADSEDELVMDTIGGELLGLIDFEIRFAGYDLNLIAGLLYDYVDYLFEKGMVIDEGDTILGPDMSQCWTCHFGQSTYAPDRKLIRIKYS